MSWAMVPPRDPSKWAEWQQQMFGDQQSGIRRMPAATQGVGTRAIIPRILVIMTNFANYELVSTKADVDSMFNGQNWTKDGATGSVRQYFYDQSNGTYNPQFDIVGPVTLAYDYAHYGYNVGGKNTAGAGLMVTEACDSVNRKFPEVNFADYDLDNDGKVDMVYLLFAGFGENDPPEQDIISDPDNLPWPHYWNINSANYGSNRNVFDGKIIYAYEISNELDGWYSTKTKHVIAGIGIVCHEFGHGLGLPDLYEYSHNHKTLGSWDIMDYGPYSNDMHTPPSYSAYERFFMGWLEPTFITEADDLQLDDIAASNEAFLISESDEFDFSKRNTSKYYLLENRQQKGWDTYVPGHGLLLTKIDNPAGAWSDINADYNNYRIDIIEADGLTPQYISRDDNGFLGKPGDLFPAGATEYLGIADHAITDITENADGTVSFKYRGGKPSDPTAVELPATETPQAYKTVENGRLIIHNNGNRYSIHGILID